MRTSDLLEDHGKHFVFEKDFGHDVRFTFVGELGGKRRRAKLRSTVGGLSTGKPREAVLRLSTWSGISPGAIHHYARINLGYPSYEFAANGRHWGYSVTQTSGAPWHALHVELEVMRRSDKRDVQHDKDMKELAPDDFLYGNRKLGDWTYQFWSEEEAKEAAIAFFKSHFAPGWILVPDAWVEEERPIFAIIDQGVKP